jgi:hypothetical protein
VFALVLLLFAATRFAAQAKNNQAVIPPGQIVEKVVCARDANQSYALYLPANYVGTRRWPVLYAFDPGARGRVPVERFKEAAESLAGSSSARTIREMRLTNRRSIRGMRSPATLRNDSRSMTDGLMRRFLWRCTGVAAVRHAMQDCLAGVIAGGAGFPEGIEPATTMHFALFLTAGVDDFNFAEIKSLDEPLNRAGMTPPD